MKATLSDIEPRIVIKENKTEGILNYDIDNLYPQRVDDIVANSGTAKACLRIYTRFIIGGGMTDPDFYKAIVNRDGLTVDKLLRKVAQDLGKFSGLALHINYNQLGEIVEVNPVKFEHVRMTIDRTKAAVYDDWGRRRKKTIQKKDIDFIDWYNPNLEIIEQQAETAGGWDNYKGQILYWTPYGIEYPIAVYDAVLEDMETEGQMKLFRFRSAAQNFLASHVLLTSKAATDDEAEEFADTVRDFQGAKNTASILILEKEQPNDTFELHKVDIQNYDGLHEKTEESSKNNIIESFLIPKPLLLRGTSSIGASKEVEEAKEFYNGITADDRLVIEEIFAEIFRRFEAPINPTDDYSIIPVPVKKAITQEYFPYVTKNQILASIDLPEVEEKEADDKLLAEKLGVGGTQALVAVLTNPDLTDDQKVGTLQVLFGITTEQANAMLALNKTPGR